MIRKFTGKYNNPEPVYSKQWNLKTYKAKIIDEQREKPHIIFWRLYHTPLINGQIKWTKN